MILLDPDSLAVARYRLHQAKLARRHADRAAARAIIRQHMAARTGARPLAGLRTTDAQAKITRSAEARRAFKREYRNRTRKQENKP